MPKDLPAADTTRHKGIPVTTPARTVLDLSATRRSDRAVSRAIHEAEVQCRVNHRQLKEQIAGGRPGATRLAKLTAAGPAPTRSELEDRMLEFLARHGFPTPVTNTFIGGLEVDFFFPHAKLVIETDGKRFHNTDFARRNDAAKQAALEAAGYRVVRITWDQVTTDEERTAMRLRQSGL
jgi:very-short-patch-repair endonuclease